MKKFVILLLICLCFLLCSCSADTSGYQNELTCTDWSAELDGGGKISLSFDGGNASLIMMSGKTRRSFAENMLPMIQRLSYLCRNFTETTPLNIFPTEKSLICHTTVQKSRSAVPITRKKLSKSAVQSFLCTF